MGFLSLLELRPSPVQYTSVLYVQYDTLPLGPSARCHVCQLTRAGKSSATGPFKEGQ